MSILSFFLTGDNGELLWTNNWTTFLDTMMQINLLTRPGSDLSLPTGIKSLKIDPEFHKSSLILADQSGVLTRTIHILIAVLAYTGHIYTSCQMFYQQ
jgi:hypothetical protein